MADDIFSLLGGMKQPTPTESFAQNLLGYQRPSMSMEPMAQSMLGYQPSSIELDPMARTIQPSIMDRVSSGLGGIGSAFTGPGSNARLQALAASLLTGPSRTPISFGSQLAKGLLAGTQAAQAEQDRQLKRDLLAREQQYKESLLDYKTSKLGVPEIDAVKGFNLQTGQPEALESSTDPRTGQITYKYLATGDPVDWSKTSLSAPDVAEGPRPQDIVGYQYVIDAEGNVRDTYFDKRTRKTVFADNGEPITAGVVPIDQGDIPKQKFFGETREALSTEEKALTSMDKYMQGLSKDPKGMERYFNRVIANLKTAFKGRLPTQEEISTAINEGRLQGIIGLVREDVVGPGVMTEFDAERIIMSLGGNYSIFQSPEAALQLIGETRDKKFISYSELLGEYNRALETLPAGNAMKRVYQPKDAYQRGLFANQAWFDNGGTLDQWNQLSEEDKRGFLGY
jgi:hypothetical protein